MKTVFCFLWFATLACSQNLTGTWRLVSAAEFRPNGEMLLPFGKKPVGVLMYDGNGNMCAHIQYDGKAENGETYIAYFGTYKVDQAAGTVSHQVLGTTRESYRGTTQLRFVTLDGNRLTLGLLPQIVNGEARLRSVTWERVTKP